MTVDRRIAYPSNRIPVLKWWEGIYDYVFFALHPFFHIRKNNYDADPGDIGGYERVLDYASRPDNFDDIIKRRGIPVSWRDVHMAVAPNEPETSFFRAIWLLSVVGFQERANIALQKKIAAYCEKKKLYLPEGDGLPSILEPLVHRFLVTFETGEVTVYDEFRDNSFIVPISVFTPDGAAYWLPNSFTSSAVWAIHLPDPGVLICWEFDGADALIAMTEKAQKRARPEDFFEGRYADADTYCDWLNPVDFFERDE